MEINEQLFEDVLTGKLKGTFVLRNGFMLSSEQLDRNDNWHAENCPYRIRYRVYRPNGGFGFTNGDSWDIVDFIAETNMKENELTIEIPGGYEIQIPGGHEIQMSGGYKIQIPGGHEIQIPIGYEIDKEKSTFEKIMFKKKENTKPRSWEEYREKVPENKLYKVWGVIEGKELAEASIAMMQLMSLRKEWIGDWEPDWSNDTNKYCIIIFDNKYIVKPFSRYYQTLSFPTEEMAKDFRYCFSDLLDIAKPLI